MNATPAPVEYEALPEDAAVLFDLTAHLILNETRMAAMAGGDQQELSEAMKNALFGVFEAWLRALRASGPQREHLTRLYAQIMTRELASLTKPSAV